VLTLDISDNAKEVALAWINRYSSDQLHQLRASIMADVTQEIKDAIAVAKEEAAAEKAEVLAVIEQKTSALAAQVADLQAQIASMPTVDKDAVLAALTDLGDGIKDIVTPETPPSP